MLIVRLDKGLYIGNMGSTTYRAYAKRYKTTKGAKIALASYRTRRPYVNADIIDICAELGLVT